MMYLNRKVKISARQKESVGDRWLGKRLQGVVEGDLGCFEGRRAMALPCVAMIKNSASSTRWCPSIGIGSTSMAWSQSSTSGRSVENAGYSSSLQLPIARV